MAKNSTPATKRSAASGRFVGTTSDGIDIYAPRVKPTHFTPAQIRRTIQEVVKTPDGARPRRQSPREK